MALLIDGLGRVQEGRLVKVEPMHMLLQIARNKLTTQVEREYIYSELSTTIRHLRETADWFEKELGKSLR